MKSQPEMARKNNRIARQAFKAPKIISKSAIRVACRLWAPVCPGAGLELRV